MSVKDAANFLGAQTVGDVDTVFTGVVDTDAKAEAGDLFLAFPGARVHGAQFAQSAIEKGAVAVLTDTEGAKLVAGLPVIIANNARVAGAALSAMFFRNPILAMESIGITGTNGKTTVTTLLYQILSAIHRESGLIGTVETRIGRDRIESVRTTPEAAELQMLAALMVEQHIRHCIMEVSSHSLDQHRMVGSHFAAVGFTNLTQDHLDYHKDMESYFAAKAKLFTFEYADQGFVNIDDPYGARLSDSAEIPVITLSRYNPKATWHFVETIPTTGGSEFIIRGRDGVLIQSRTPLFGGFNLDNLLMAVAISYHLGVDPLQLAEVIPALAGPAGRLQSIQLGQEFKALVDYAHTPDAVEKVLAAAREFTTGKVIAVLGCGGDRDATKRPGMGAALLSGSDIAIFTSDNPRSESPSSILQQMSNGLSITLPSTIMEDRAEAIAYAVSLAGASDTVLVLGKGHETGQEINGVKHPFDDCIELAKAIEARS